MPPSVPYWIFPTIFKFIEGLPAAAGQDDGTVGDGVAPPGEAEAGEPGREDRILFRIGFRRAEDMGLRVEALRHGEMKRLGHAVKRDPGKVLVALQHIGALHLLDGSDIAIALAVRHDHRNAFDFLEPLRD